MLSPMPPTQDVCVGWLRHSLFHTYEIAPSFARAMCSQATILPPTAHRVPTTLAIVLARDQLPCVFSTAFAERLRAQELARHVRLRIEWLSSRQHEIPTYPLHLSK